MMMLTGIHAATHVHACTLYIRGMDRWFFVVCLFNFTGSLLFVCFPRFCEEDIDQILEQRAHVVQLENEGKGSTFSKASFVADESSDINIDDPDFWQKWAEKAKLDLDELVNKVYV